MAPDPRMGTQADIYCNGIFSSHSVMRPTSNVLAKAHRKTFLDDRRKREYRRNRRFGK